uniref:5-hydroxytryptamine receptor 3A-like n=2 Tax=Kryptolebias marmoratus TaxID=37003 RepID=A0A3Q2ZZ39_KRYMA
MVYANSRYRLTYTCQLNLFRFPFDEQQCNITFSSMSSGEEYIKLEAARNDTILTKLSNQIMTTQGEWKLEGMEIIEYTSAENISLTSKLVYMVTLQRKPFLYVVNLIMPLLFLLVLDLASFFISEASGEKLGFKVTILLSVFVLLLILKDILPSTEDDLPMMAIYCVSVFTLVWISVLEAMLVSFLTNLDSSHGEDEPNSEDVKEQIQQDADGHKEPAGVEEKAHPEASRPPLEQLGDDNLLKQTQGKVKADRLESERQKRGVKNAGFCTKLAAVIDVVFFVLYLTAVVVSQISMFVIWNLPEF